MHETYGKLFQLLKNGNYELIQFSLDEFYDLYAIPNDTTKPMLLTLYVSNRFRGNQIYLSIHYFGVNCISVWIFGKYWLVAWVLLGIKHRTILPCSTS